MTGYQIINNNAEDNSLILNYKKKIISDSIKELRKLELEISELEASR